MKRYPIKLSDTTVALISIFERWNNIEDLWFFDLVEKDEERNSAEFAAKELFHQLKDECNGYFLEALLLETIKEIKSGYSTDGLLEKIKTIIEN